MPGVPMPILTQHKCFLPLLLILFILAGCGGSSGSDSNPVPPPTQNPNPPGDPDSPPDNPDNPPGDPDNPDTPPDDPDTPPDNPDNPPAAEPGLDARPTNTTCLAPQPPSTDSSVQLTRVFGDLSFSNTVGLLHEPGNDDRWYVIEQAGRVRVFDNSTNPNLRTFIDIRDRVDSGPGEAGLLAMAFHPNFATNGQVFLYYIRDAGSAPSRDTLSRFTLSAGGQTLDAASEEILLSIEHPFNNHYGGQLGFDNAGYLYLSLGDGGSGGDPGNRAQNTRNLFGSMLRFEVNNTNGAAYGIPASNPFAGNALCTNADGTNAAGTDCPEIFAWGLRNPWRWSFDAATDEIWLADVGQDRLEEINRIALGGNYGWRLREGNQCFNPSSNCGTAGLIDPVAVIPHPDAQSITGGYVYRGSNIPGLVGQYIVADFITGRLWRLVENEGTFEPDLLDETGMNIASFAEDMANELYLVTHNGRIYRLDPAGSTSDNFPRLLSQTGCVSAADPTQPASGLIPYTVNAPFWSDGADKQRWLALPDNTTITIDDAHDWDFPPGSVLMKNFHLNERLIETRLFMRHDDGQWAGYSYEWNSSGTDASLVLGDKVVNVNGQEWIYPSSSDCMQCHTAAAGFSLGLETAQLNGDFTYPQTGRTANQLITHDAIDTLSAPLSNSPADLPRLVNPADTSAPLDARARAYLHSNCANCHQPGGPTNVNLDLRHTTALVDMNICNVIPQNGNLNIADARLLAPGTPNRSVLLQRMMRRDALGMPPLGSKLVDEAGADLIEEWIGSITSCP